MKLGIVLGSIREGRKGEEVARWVLEQAGSRDGIDPVLLDLRAFEVPLLTTGTVPMAADRSYASEQVRRWSEAVDSCDAYVLVTPEYNHSVPGAFKNAVDSLGPEWSGKAAGIVGYGFDGAVRATEHWRLILANFHMVVVRQALALSLVTEFGEDGFTPAPRRAGELGTLLDQVVAMTHRTAG